MLQIGFLWPKLVQFGTKMSKWESVENLEISKEYFLTECKYFRAQKWLAAYRDAMSFRTSHYFVSFLSEASAIAAGFGFKPADATNWRSRWEIPVATPVNIEVPRSLVEVVVSWNNPMHRWLKKCKSTFDKWFEICMKNGEKDSRKWKVLTQF